MEQAILDLGFYYGEDPFFGKCYMSTEKCTKMSMAFFSEDGKSKPYETFRYLISNIYSTGEEWNITDMLTDCREIAVNVADIKLKLEEMKKIKNAL